MRNRGTTLIEMVLVVALTAAITGSVALLYGFTFRTIANSTTLYAASSQARQVADLIGDTVRDALSCTTVAFGGSTALKCVMPATGVGSDVQGNPKSYTALTTSRSGVERFGSGRRIWYFMSDASGNPNTPGTLLWRAERSDDATITSSDVNRSATYYYGGSNHRFPLVSSVAFTVDSAQNTVVVSIVASSLMRDERAGTAESETSRKQQTPLSRKFFWRNWRP